MTDEEQNNLIQDLKEKGVYTDLVKKVWSLSKAIHEHQPRRSSVDNIKLDQFNNHIIPIIDGLNQFLDITEEHVLAILCHDMFEDIKGIYKDIKHEYEECSTEYNMIRLSEIQSAWKEFEYLKEYDSPIPWQSIKRLTKTPTLKELWPEACNRESSAIRVAARDDVARDIKTIDRAQNIRTDYFNILSLLERLNIPPQPNFVVQLNDKDVEIITRAYLYLAESNRYFELYENEKVTTAQRELFIRNYNSVIEYYNQILNHPNKITRDYIRKTMTESPFYKKKAGKALLHTNGSKIVFREGKFVHLPTVIHINNDNYSEQ